MKRYNLISVLLLCFSLTALAQEDKIQSDRPGETLTPLLTKKGYFQFEFGFEKEQQNKDEISWLHPEFGLKYGLSKRFEIRTEFKAETIKQLTANKFQYGLKPVEIGFKGKLLEEKGALPTTTFYTQVGIPLLASKDHQTTNVIPKIRLLFENRLTKKLHLNYNIGAEWNGEEPSPKWLYSIDQEIDLSKQWEVFIELFGNFQKAQAPQHLLDGGFGFFPTTNIKVDASAGIGLGKEAPDYFVSAGLSVRLR